MLTMVASRTTISCAKPVTAKIHQRLFAPPSAPAVERTAGGKTICSAMAALTTSKTDRARREGAHAPCATGDALRAPFVVWREAPGQP